MVVLRQWTDGDLMKEGIYSYLQTFVFFTNFELDGIIKQ